MAVDERAAELKKASENLTRVTQELQKFNESAGVEVANIVGRNLKKVTDPFVSSIMNIPGVAMLGDIGKSLGNRLFAKRKEKREMEHLRHLINERMEGVELSKKQFEALKLNEEIAQAQKEETEKMTAAAKTILGIGKDDESGDVKKGLAKLDESLKDVQRAILSTNPEQLEQLKLKEVKLNEDIKSLEEKSNLDKIDQQTLVQLKEQKEKTQELITQGSETTDTSVLLEQQLSFLKDQKTSLVELTKVGSDSSNVEKTTAEVLGGIQNSAAQQVALAQSGLKSGAAQAEAENELQRREDRRDILFGDIANGIQDMKDGIINGLAGLKDKGLLGLGILAGLVAAPFVAIKAFFIQLAVEVKVLRDIVKGIKNGKFFTSIGKILNSLFDTISKGFKTLMPGAGTGTNPFSNVTKSFTDSTKKVSNIFKPIFNTVDTATDAVKNSTAVKTFSKVTENITRFFKAISDVFGKAGTGQFLKGDTIKMFGKFGDDMSQLVGKIKIFFKPVVDIIGKVTTGASNIIKALPGFSAVTGFAATIGKTLGKIFLPITILMGVFDFVTGFMEGYKEDGIIGGIREGIIGVVDGLVGGLIRLVTGALSFILDLLGFDKFAESITKNVNEALDGLFDSFRGLFDIIKGIFTFDLGLIGDGIGKIFDGIVNVITAPFDMVYGLVQDIFSFVGFELPDFDLSDMITGFIGDAYNFVKDKVTGFFSYFGFGGGDEEEELERTKEEERKLRDAGAVSTDGLVTSTSTRNGITDVVASEARLQSQGFEVASPEQRAELERLAAERTANAQQALEDFRNAPKLSDAIGNVTEKMSAVFSSIGSTVSSGFSVAKNFATDLFTISDQEKEAMSASLTKLSDITSSGLSSATSFIKNLFTFSEEDASIAGITTKMIDIVLAPYNIAINFLKGIFGFGVDEEGIVPPFSLGELIVGVVTDIIDFFKGLFDIDIMGLVKSIPGADKILDFFGFSGDKPEVVTPQTSQSDALLAAEMERDDLQRAVDKGGFFQVGRSSEDEVARINQLNEEIARLKMAERQEQVTVVNNNNIVNANTSNNASTTTIAPMRDTTPPPGTLPAYG